MLLRVSILVLIYIVKKNICENIVPQDDLYRLDVVHYNDFHARFEETSLEGIKCRFNNDSCLGGFSRLYHEIDVLFKEKPHALLLNAGDSFQGTFWYTLLKWNVTQYFMNMLPHDAHVIGNHEFDDGVEGLAPYLAALKAPVVVANMDTSREPIMHGLCKPHIIAERRGRSIGIIGLITPDTKVLSSSGRVEFMDPFEATRREVEILTRKGVNIIILISHCGMEIDKQLANMFRRDVDIIVGGHSHRDKTANPPYPVFIEGSNDNRHIVVIVQAFSFTKFVGNLSVYFDVEGHYVKWDGTIIPLNRSVSEDPKISAKLMPYAEMVRNAENKPVGENLRTMSHEDCAHGECSLGNIILDAFNEHAKHKVHSSYDYIAFVQRSQLTFTLAKGTITQGNIVELLSYYDKVVTFELLGRYVLEALEKSVTDVESLNPFIGPWLLQVSGLRVSYNVSMPEGHRVTKVSVGPDKQPLDKNGHYQVTMPYYIAYADPGYQMFNKKRNVTQLGYDQPLLIKYIKEHSPLRGNVDGRIEINT